MPPGGAWRSSRSPSAQLATPARTPLECRRPWAGAEAAGPGWGGARAGAESPGARGRAPAPAPSPAPGGPAGQRAERPSPAVEGAPSAAGAGAGGRRGRQRSSSRPGGPPPGRPGPCAGIAARVRLPTFWQANTASTVVGAERGLPCKRRRGGESPAGRQRRGGGFPAPSGPRGTPRSALRGPAVMGWGDLRLSQRNACYIVSFHIIATACSLRGLGRMGAGAGHRKDKDVRGPGAPTPRPSRPPSPAPQEAPRRAQMRSPIWLRIESETAESATNVRPRGKPTPAAEAPCSSACDSRIATRQNPPSQPPVSVGDWTVRHRPATGPVAPSAARRRRDGGEARPAGKNPTCTARLLIPPRPPRSGRTAPASRGPRPPGIGPARRTPGGTPPLWRSRPGRRRRRCTPWRPSSRSRRR